MNKKVGNNMFWILKNTLSDGAAAFFSAINNNITSGNKDSGTSKNVGKKSGYNKLACCDETSATTAADISNGNLKTNLKTPLTSAHNGESTDSSSASEFELEEDEFTDDSEYDESLTCNVCDRSFCSPRALAQHQQKKRHFGCSACDSLFPSLMALEHHKEEFEHWSADENILVPNSQSEESSEETSEEMERLL